VSGELKGKEGVTGSGGVRRERDGENTLSWGIFARTFCASRRKLALKAEAKN